MKIAPYLLCLSAIGLFGCAAMPTAGPTKGEVIDQATTEGRRNFDLVEVDSRVVATLLNLPAPSLKTRFEKYGKPPPQTIGVGDTVSVSIYQMAAAAAVPPSGGPGTSNAWAPITIPDQVVTPDGAISVPYAGRVPAAGRTPLEVQRAIDQRLAEHVIAPQAIVTVTKSVSQTVTVDGDAIKGAVIPLSDRGERLLNIIATAGGATAPLYETLVQVTRHGVTATISMSTLVSHPDENIYVWPGDVVTVEHKPKTFMVFGATTQNTQISFGARKINLAQALAKSGGLLDARADPTGVFLFRFEPPPIVKALGAPPLVSTRNDLSPILYHLDLRNAASYFLAERFPMQNNDIIYVANAEPATALQKFFTLLSTVTGPVISGVIITRGTP
jgi:polysaccharide biosynthesis/export protein